MASEKENKYAIHEAAREGKISVVESLLNANPRLANRRDEDDRLAIHWAVSMNHLDIVRILVQAKDFDIDAQDGSGWTSLMMVSSRKEGGDEIVDLLLSKGADVNIVTNSGQTALHFASSKNNLDTARKLIAHKASTRTKDKRNVLPLHRAAAIGAIPMIKLLLECRSPINASDLDGMTALHHAIAEGHGDAAVLLLKAGIETDKKSSDGLLAIDLAPDQKVRIFIMQEAEREGIDLITP